MRRHGRVQELKGKFLRLVEERGRISWLGTVLRTLRQVYTLCNWNADNLHGRQSMGTRYATQ